MRGYIRWGYYPASPGNLLRQGTGLFFHWIKIQEDRLCRFLHGGQTNKKLRQIQLTRDKWLDAVPSASPLSKIKHEKERFVKELLEAQTSLASEFENVLHISNAPIRSSSTQEAKRVKTSEAFRIYRLLRPYAPPFYKEDSTMKMENRMHQLLLNEGSSSTTELILPSSDLEKEGNHTKFDPFQYNLPVVNPKAYCIALDAVMNSLADDLEVLCILLNVENLPISSESNRFGKLLDCLLDSFKLRKEPSAVDPWMVDCWPRLKRILPNTIANLPKETISEWLKNHLKRVKVHQKQYRSKNRRNGRLDTPSADSEWYNFAEDFIYDEYPLPPEFKLERQLKFPLEKAAFYLKNFVSFFSSFQISNTTQEEVSQKSAMLESVAEQFQDCVLQMRKIGLRNWLSMDIEESLYF
ncbi:putative 30S ribosomal protein S5 [Cardiosporidium cionae]|uniref:30S ribosomal protein S5 n=1 Tax=Cardiosporidium cionae TaxID=476202 RepID=A0ABQ7J5L5_9APIC|nr:putative 30S ribosomal protein S5 [Cardiosporidium cionae]|eukprot:KAF8819283.1 putative 30S ribosomal protein S5 [Cardiosporidium cionae]